MTLLLKIDEFESVFIKCNKHSFGAALLCHGTFMGSSLVAYGEKI